MLPAKETGHRCVFLSRFRHRPKMVAAEEERLVVSLSYETPMVEQVEGIAIARGRQTVGDEDDRLGRRCLLDGFMDGLLGALIQVAGGLIEDSTVLSVEQSSTTMISRS